MKLKLKNYKKELDLVYKDYIKPCLDKKEPLYPAWTIPNGNMQDNHSHPPIGAPILERCSEETLNNINNEKTNIDFYDVAHNNCNFSIRVEPYLSDTERHWITYYVNPDSRLKWYSNCDRSQFKPLLDKISEVHNGKYAFFGAPKFYTKWRDMEGYMGWHTNYSQFPLYKVEPKFDRTYFVYNKSEGSFFRYTDEKGKVITIEEPKGWSINTFKLRNETPFLWHCVYTPDIRFSIGVRELYDAEVETWTEINYPI